MTASKKLTLFDPNATILITGGTGFVGSHLVEYLLKQNASNIHVTTYNDEKTYVHNLLPPEQIHQVNLIDKEAIGNLFKQLQPTHVFHLAALSAVASSFEKASFVMINNEQLQLNVLESVKTISPESRLLIVGSAQEYDVLNPPLVENETIDESRLLGPANPYGVSKVSQDLLALAYHYSFDLDIVRVRPFNHIGERQTTAFAVPAFAEQIAIAEMTGEKSITVGNLEAIRDFTDVKDVIKAYCVLMDKGRTGDVYNVGSGQGISVQDVLSILIELSETEIEVVQDPDKLRPLDVPRIIADNAKIAELGWKPTIDIKQTLQRVLEYWRNSL